ncbi:CDP-glucose 4,6-dehydratase [Cyclobacterium xiamenense]|uniref:CDP-glucose 4,6-dehydratase n=1 Tax=Cyclobacterium xiamenense TaxID=1297121 RepID=UPI0019D64555|nr:CDP-glucose 4,6-dehydratase [Cyclobacterium xiamenense]
MRRVNSDFWKNKKVFMTGHTGFKGSWLALWLQEMGAHVKGYSLAPPTAPSLFTAARVSENMISENGDIRNLEQLTMSMRQFEPEIVLHLAAQPLVRLSYESPIDTYDVNVLGTAKVLEAARSCACLKSLVVVTTDKCYENNEWAWGYRENERMGGYDPYSSSKGCAELIASAYRRSFFSEPGGASVATARAGNVIGGGDWAKDRLIPDILSAFEKNRPVVIRNPMATRPWQHVLEPLSGYLILAEELYVRGSEVAEAWNFGPDEDDCKPVSWVLDQMIRFWGDGASWCYDDEPNPHEAVFLKLDCSKAKHYLKWEPRWRVDEALKRTVSWYQVFMRKGNVRKLTLNEIEDYNT